MRRIRVICGAVIAAAVLSVATLPCAAQHSSRAQTINLVAVMPEPLTVEVMEGAAVDLKLANGVTAGGATSTVQTRWTLAQGRQQVRIWAWVADGAAGLSSSAQRVQIGNVAITEANVAGSATAQVSGSAGGTAARPFSGSGYAGTVNLQVEAQP